MRKAEQGAGRDTGSVLVVQHEDEAPPAWFGEWLTEAGLRLDVRHPYAGDELPLTLDGNAGLLVLGGEMGAYDDPAHPWLRATKRLLREAVDTRVPTLGICLGHQLLAVATGGRVEPHPTGRQRGLYPMDWTDAAVDDALFGPLVRAGGYDEPVAVQWNVDVVAELPPGAQALARSADGVLQAMRVGDSAWGIQAHPEAGVDVVGTWSLDASDQPLVATLGPAEPRLRACWRPLADGFAEHCGARAPVPAADRT